MMMMTVVEFPCPHGGSALVYLSLSLEYVSMYVFMSADPIYLPTSLTQVETLAPPPEPLLSPSQHHPLQRLPKGDVKEKEEEGGVVAGGGEGAISSSSSSTNGTTTTSSSTIPRPLPPLSPSGNHHNNITEPGGSSTFYNVRRRRGEFFYVAILHRTLERQPIYFVNPFEYVVCLIYLPIYLSTVLF